MQEKQILGMIKSEASWEQVIYQVVAWEGLDPWDLDLMALTKGFLDYLKKISNMDFKVPAKYLMVVANLLRMKSEHLKLMEVVEGSEVCDVPELEEFELDPDHMEVDEEGVSVNPITTPPKRLARRKIVVNDLVKSLQRTLRSQKRRRKRKHKRRKKIKISKEDITKKINRLYDKITGLLTEMKKDEVEFSEVVEKWERGNIVDNFLPMIHLDKQKKIKAKQKKIFKEIFIKKGKCS